MKTTKNIFTLLRFILALLSPGVLTEKHIQMAESIPWKPDFVALIAAANPRYVNELKRDARMLLWENVWRI